MSRFTWKLQIKNKKELIAVLSQLSFVDEFVIYNSLHKTISQVLENVRNEIAQTIERPMLICFVKLKDKKSSISLNKKLEGNIIKIWHPKKIVKNIRIHYRNHGSFQYFKNNIIESDPRGDFEFFEQTQYKLLVKGKKLSQITSDAFVDKDLHLFVHLIQNWKSYDYYDNIISALHGSNENHDVLSSVKCKIIV